MLRIEVVLHYSGINMLMTAGSEVVSIPIYLKLLSPILSYLITVKRWRSSRQQTHRFPKRILPKASIYNLPSFLPEQMKEAMCLSVTSCPSPLSLELWTALNIHEHLWGLTIHMYPTKHSMDGKNIRSKLWANYLISRAPISTCVQLSKVRMPWTELGVGSMSEICDLCCSAPTKNS